MTPVLDRIAKLLALAEGQGTNPNEAANAAAQAQRLMLEHNIARATVDASTVEPDEPIGRDELWRRPGRYTPGWIATLAAGVAGTNRCRVGIGRAYVSVYGRPSDVAVTRYLLTYLIREIDRLVPKGFGKAYADAFRKGAVHEVLTRLFREQRVQRVEATAAGHGAALVKIDQHDAAVVLYSKQYVSGKTHQTTAPTDHEGFYAGRAAGSKIALTRGLDGAPAKRLGPAK